MKKYKKHIGLVLAVCMCLTSLCSCKQNETTQGTDENGNSITVGTASDTMNDYNIFDDDYNPLDENYDPYGNSENKKSNKSDNDKDTTSDSTEKTSDSENSVEEVSSKSNQKSSDKVVLKVSSSNGWENGSDKFTQVDFTVENNSDKDIANWTATITASDGVKIDQNWNCDASVNGNKITVTPASHNSTVSAGGQGTFGIVFCNAGDISASKCSITYGDVTSTAVSGNTNSNNNSQTQNSTGVGNNNPAIVNAKDVPEPTTDDWLSVKGNKIVDKSGKQVWLTGVNWFGYNTGTNTFDGLWSCDLNTSLDSIADRGFNLLRIPMSSELILQWSNGTYPTANYNQSTNSYLVGMNSLEIFDYVIGQCRANGIKIMIDIHCAKTDASGHNYPVWYNGSISEKDYINSLEWIANRYKNDDTIIAYDIENEPHGKPNESPRAKWDNSTDSDNWKYVAEKTAKAILAKNPNVLIMVEGIEIYPMDTKTNGNFTSTNNADYYFNWWGGNLRGVKDNPVDLGKYQNKLVYSPHDYGPTVYQQPWLTGNYTYESLHSDCWDDNWLYIYDDNIAPLLIGEWGGYMKDPNLKWMTYMRKLIVDNKLNHTFWCFNANSGDTGGLVLDDFTTWDEEKYSFVKEALWQQNGKFVGLDHKIPLGDNGITLSDAKSAK